MNTLRLAALFALYLTVPASAQAPRTISLQGTLADAEGQALTSPVDLTFRLYTGGSGGSPLWAESHPSVPLSEGRYDILLGSGSGDDLSDVDFNQPLFLGVQVGTDPELAPRTTLAGVPSAMTLALPADLRAEVPAAGDAVLTVRNEAPAGQTITFKAVNDSETGYAIWGSAARTTGVNVGVQGSTNSETGKGVSGFASSSSGSGVGVYGQSASEEGIGVVGQGSHGVEGLSTESDGRGVYGFVATLDGVNQGVYGESFSPDGVGVSGRNHSSTGDAVGVSGTSTSESGVGVLGQGAASADTTFGVVGISDSEIGVGVAGYGAASPKKTIGILGKSASVVGIGVYAEAPYTGESINWGVFSRGRTAVYGNGAVTGVYGAGGSTGGWFVGQVGIRAQSNNPQGTDLQLAGYRGLISATEEADSDLGLSSNGDVEIRLLDRLKVVRNDLYLEPIFSVDTDGLISTTGDYYGRGHLYLFAYQGDGSSGTAYIQARDRSETSNLDLQFRTKAGTAIQNVMRLTSDGRVGIGTETPSTALEVNGDVIADNIGSPSDRRFKRDIEPVEGALETVLELKGVRYSWRTEDFPDRRFDSEPHLGFIAQDVRQVLPEAVGEGTDGSLTLSYQQIVPVLVEAIKEQQLEIEFLRSEVAALRGPLE